LPLQEVKDETIIFTIYISVQNPGLRKYFTRLKNNCIVLEVKINIKRKQKE